MRRRRLVMDVLCDMSDGVRAMGELDFARLCRLVGLPEPSRQVVRLGSHGRVYLDVWWEEWGVIVEIEGARRPFRRVVTVVTVVTGDTCLRPS